MNFALFPVGATNIFPAANGINGSQLLTEWNLRCREGVDTSSDITYEVGHSFVHGEEDFFVSIKQDDTGAVVNNYTLNIAPGRAVINGHYIELLTDITIDLLEANAKLISQSMEPLQGDLAVGLRTFYASEESIAGSLLVEGDDGMYLGIQVVVLPLTEFITPQDSPNDKNAVTADLLLANIYFANNAIQRINNNVEKIEYLPAERIRNIEGIVNTKYVTKLGLNPKKIYAFAGKGHNPSTGQDTWEDVTDSTMIWDANPVRTTDAPTYSQSQFVTSSDKVYLCAVHKQVEGMETYDGHPEYYAPRLIELPVANYGTSTPGVISPEYTQQIKHIADQVNDFRTTLTGKQIQYRETFVEGDELPAINPAWECGDYILVGADSVALPAATGVSAPATMYVVIPGIIRTIIFKESVLDSAEIPADITGVPLGYIDWNRQSGKEEPNTTDPEKYPEFFDPDTDQIRGRIGVDYFYVKYEFTDTEGVDHVKYYYYTVATSSPRGWSDAVIVTGQIPLATDTAIGGFYNVESTDTDAGYVYRDDAGRLRLVDYALLRSGVLAYQLGEDLKLPSGLTSEEIQVYLNEYVNERVAFANATQLESDSPNCIHVHIPLYEESSPTEITIKDIDCRFNTSVCLHIEGSANENTIINISDCAKIKIDNDIEGTPVINIYRSCIYYDPYIFNYIRGCTRDSLTFTGMEDIKLWYEIMHSADPNLVVNDMTVRELDGPVIPTQTSVWDSVGAEANDNHYLVALGSLTFAGNGDVIGCTILLANNSTDNVLPGEKIAVNEFELPQGSGLTYPKSCMTRQLKITGTFTSAYLSQKQWYLTDTSFSALTNVFDMTTTAETAKGSIAFHSKTTVLDNSLSYTSIPAWEPDTYHIFSGGAIN